MPSLRFKVVVAVMSALTVASFLLEPFVVAHGPPERPVAAEFSLPTIDNSTFSLSARPNGSLVLVDFMATWCYPCRLQLADLREVRVEVPRALLTIVSVDEEYSIAPAAVDEFRTTFGRVAGSQEESGWFFVVDTVEEHVGLKYGVTALPTLVLVDRDGRIARTWFGGVSSTALVAAIADELGV